MYFTIWNDKIEIVPETSHTNHSPLGREADWSNLKLGCRNNFKITETRNDGGS